MFFKSMKGRGHEVIERRKYLGEPCTFSNKFLDDALCGIYPDDLVVITARTGGGKTELSSQIAEVNAMAGKRVHLLALEAFDGEIESRILFRLISQAFYRQKYRDPCGDVPDYQRWYYGKQGDLLGQFECDMAEEFENRLSKLNIFYRDAKFNVNDFEIQMGMISDETDLVIIDHLHYFDLDTDDEHRELKRTMKQIRDIATFHRKPTVLVAHVRKADKRTAGPMPDIDDIYGSSDISKIATKIIATAPAYDQPRDANNKNILPTYFKILKNRLNGSVTRSNCLAGFNISTNKYENNYTLGFFDRNDNFQNLRKDEYPKWATWYEPFQFKPKDVPNHAQQDLFESRPA